MIKDTVQKDLAGTRYIAYGLEACLAVHSWERG